MYVKYVNHCICWNEWIVGLCVVMWSVKIVFVFKYINKIFKVWVLVLHRLEIKIVNEICKNAKNYKKLQKFVKI